jgi:hypothetical protein
MLHSIAPVGLVPTEHMIDTYAPSPSAASGGGRGGSVLSNAHVAVNHSRRPGKPDGIDCPLPIANPQLPTLNCQPSTLNCQLPTANRLSFLLLQSFVAIRSSQEKTDWPVERHS